MRLTMMLKDSGWNQIYIQFITNSFMPSILFTLYKVNTERVDIANYYIQTMKN